jgi:hypothetical protein
MKQREHGGEGIKGEEEPRHLNQGQLVLRSGKRLNPQLLVVLGFELRAYMLARQVLFH